MKPRRQILSVLGLVVVLGLTLGGCGRTPTDFPQPPDMVLLVGDGLWRYPTWSPTGSEIAFLYAGSDFSALLRVEVATGEVVTLFGEVDPDDKMATGGVWPLPRYPDGPTWSPQGTQIAFVYESPGPPWELLYVVDRDGSTFVNLGEGDKPVWSPNGQWIALLRPGEGIYLVRPDGTLERLLTHGHGTDPVWSPDSSSIAFVSERDGNREIYVINVDGSGERNLPKIQTVSGNRLGRQMEAKLPLSRFAMEGSGSTQWQQMVQIKPL